MVVPLGTSSALALIVLVDGAPCCRLHSLPIPSHSAAAFLHTDSPLLHLASTSTPRHRLIREFQPFCNSMHGSAHEGSETGAKRAAGGTLTGGNAAKRVRRSGSGAAVGATAEGATRKSGICPRARQF